MIFLHIEHRVTDFDTWKASFDQHEELRQKSGVRRYTVSRPIDNPNHAIIELEFDTLAQAQGLLANVQKLWERVSGILIHDPQWRFSEIVEAKELQF